MKDWELTEESFNLFLTWLSDDREAAGRKYEDIRRRVMVVLDCRGCPHPEEIADEAINRFIKRLPELIKSYRGDPLPYILVIARNVHSEDLKKQLLPLPDDLDRVPDDKPEPDESEEHVYRCLDQCLNKLDSSNRELLLDYYQSEKQAKINFRKKLASQLGLGANALRIRVHRIRSVIHTCIDDCLSSTGL